MDSLIECLLKENLRLPGVTGEKDTVKKFSQKYSKAINANTEITIKERIHSLAKVHAETLGDYDRVMEVASFKDLDLVLKWMRLFMMEACPHEKVSELDEFKNKNRENILAAIKDNQIYLIKESGVPVSMARTPGQTLTGRMVNFVFTPGELRGEGRATNCVARLSQKILDDGYKSCFLFTDLANPISNSIYKKIGYRH